MHLSSILYSKSTPLRFDLNTLRREKGLKCLVNKISVASSKEYLILFKIYIWFRSEDDVAKACSGSIYMYEFRGKFIIDGKFDFGTLWSYHIFDLILMWMTVTICHLGSTTRVAVAAVAWSNDASTIMEFYVYLDILNLWGLLGSLLSPSWILACIITAAYNGVFLELIFSLTRFFKSIYFWKKKK